MYMHNSGRAIYIAHPKTASSSIAYALLNSGWESIDGHHEIKEELIKPDMIVMSAIREPMDWYVSWYFHYKSKDPFHRWFEWFIDTGNTHTRRGAFYGLQWTNRVLFYDRIQEGLNYVLEELGFDALSLPFRNVQGREGRIADKFFDARSAGLLASERADLLKLYAHLDHLRGEKPCLILQKDGQPFLV